MRKLIIALLFTTSSLFAQEYTEIVVFDMSGVTGDTIRPISIKKLGRDIGRLIEVDFTSTNCNLLELNIGYSVGKEYALFLDTIPTVSLPVTLDKTVYSTTYKGVENNSISFDVIPYNGNYFWLGLVDNAACTTGEIKLRIAK